MSQAVKLSLPFASDVVLIPGSAPLARSSATLLICCRSTSLWRRVIPEESRSFSLKLNILGVMGFRSFNWLSINPIIPVIARPASDQVSYISESKLFNKSPRFVFHRKSDSA